MNGLEKEKLIGEVINQIDADINLGNLEALYELLDKLDIKYLEAYLPEEDISPEVQIQVYQDWTYSIIGNPKTDGWYSIDNGDEVYLKDKFEMLPEIIVTKYFNQSLKCPNKGYYLHGKTTI